MECKRIECSLGANKVSTPHLNEACKRPLLPLVSLEIEAAQRQDATWLKTLKPVLQSNCASPLCFRHIKCDQIFPHRTHSAAMIANVFCTLQMWTDHRGVNNWTSLSLFRLGWASRKPRVWWYICKCRQASIALLLWCAKIKTELTDKAKMAIKE